MAMWMHPGVLIIIGSLLLPVIRDKRLKKSYFIFLPVLSLVLLILVSFNLFGDIPFTSWNIHFLDYDLVLCKVDRLSMIFAYAFTIVTICANIYSYHVKKDLEHIPAMLYFGSTLGMIFAGDLFTLFIFWELMSLTALFLIWSNKTQNAKRAGFRYILWHIFGGVCLLGGILLHLHNTGSIDIVKFPWGTGIEYLSSYLILVGFMVNAAVPPFHTWLTDAYPAATVTGAVYLSAFTTKSAVYVLIRGFQGVEILIWIGAAMAIFGVIFALLQKNIRKLLSYHIISQVGYMICGIGLGSSMAINGSIAHAFCNILYKSLLFMTAGELIASTGKTNLSDFGGIHKEKKATFWIYMIGAFSISGFPLFSGFVSKSMVIDASAYLNQPLVWILLELASIGTFLSIVLKVPLNIWFTTDERPDIKAVRSPVNMYIGMGILAALCIIIGVYPNLLYNLLPYPVDFDPYNASHILSSMQLFLFAFIPFWFMRNKLKSENKIILDIDWFFKKIGDGFMTFCRSYLGSFRDSVNDSVSNTIASLVYLINFKDAKRVSVDYYLLSVIVLFLIFFIYYVIML